MKKILVIFFALGLFSCKKENLKEDSSTDSTPTPCTIKLVVGFSPIATLNYCQFTYTDIDGNFYQYRNEMDGQVENVDFSKPFKVTASSGITFYDPVNGPLYDDQLADYQLKKDGVVIDAQSVVTYVYEN
jgi:hypothetical protein